MDNYESKEDRAVSDLEDKIKELEADLALKDTWVKHHQESAQLSFNKASDLETQVKDLGSKLNDCAERNMKHKVSVMDLEEKLAEAILLKDCAESQRNACMEMANVAVDALEEIYFPGVPYSRLELDEHSKEVLISIIQQDIDFAREALKKIGEGV